MSIRRAARRRAVGIPIPLLTDDRLTFKAKGLAAFLLAKPDSWRIDARSLGRVGPDGRDACLSGLAELRDTGYLVTRKGQDDQGHWWTESVLYESPDDALDDTAADDAQPVDEVGDDTDEDGSPEVGKSGSGSPGPGQPGPTPSSRERTTPLPPASGGPDAHAGQHPNCRGCGTSRRGPKASDPTLVAADRRLAELDANTQRMHELAIEERDDQAGAAAARAIRDRLRGTDEPEVHPEAAAS